MRASRTACYIGVLGGAVESEAVYYRLDHHIMPHELADIVADVLIIPSQAIHPADHKRVSLTQKGAHIIVYIEKSTSSVGVVYRAKRDPGEF